jgi:hypothetical protein
MQVRKFGRDISNTRNSTTTPNNNKFSGSSNQTERSFNDFTFERPRSNSPSSKKAKCSEQSFWKKPFTSPTLTIRSSKSPKVEKQHEQVAASSSPDGFYARFHYDRDFLLQFRQVCVFFVFIILLSFFYFLTLFF